MGESLCIINTVSTKLISNYLHSYQYSPNIYKKIINIKNKSYTSMEDLIKHFVNWHTGFCVKSNSTLSYIESPKGEFGVILISDNTEKPLKCKIRSPSYYNLQALPKLVKGHYLGDLASIIGTIDIVFGEIDR